MEENIAFVQIFDFQFLMHLHILGYPEHDFTISGKCPSVCLCVCVGDKKFLASVAPELINRIL